ncbi:MAG TPA: hypothetical protein VG457_19275, partial [Planctomycetota bacterium]|nr:hypothetical protein [Planctomycetota bacterium]
TLVRSDAEISTRRLPVIPPPAGPTVDLVCILCDHVFKGRVDAAGRVRCPSCQSSFRSGRMARRESGLPRKIPAEQVDDRAAQGGAAVRLARLPPALGKCVRR